jgi:hypothetical protein
MGNYAHLVPKVMLMPMAVTGALLVAAGLGLIEPPAPLVRANEGEGVDKYEWAADLYGVPRATMLIVTGTCKVLAITDIWLLQLVPRLACVCLAVMMALVLHGHHAMGDDLLSPIMVGATALIVAATWPAADSKVKSEPLPRVSTKRSRKID